MKFELATFWLASETSHPNGSVITLCPCPTWPLTGIQYTGGPFSGCQQGDLAMARPFPQPVHHIEWPCNCFTYTAGTGLSCLCPSLFQVKRGVWSSAQQPGLLQQSQAPEDHVRIWDRLWRSRTRRGRSPRRWPRFEDPLAGQSFERFYRMACRDAGAVVRAVARRYLQI